MGQYPQPFDHGPSHRAARAMAAHRAATLASASYLTDAFRLDIHPGIVYGTRIAPPLAKFAHLPPKRGQVTSLSAAARRRLTRFFCEINTEELSAPIFVTLTFRNDRAKDKAYRCLQVWLKSIRRHYRAMKWLWRMELQQRGVIHFHLFLWHRVGNDAWIASPALAKWLSKEWHRIADPGNKAHSRYGCMVEPIESRTKARQYVAKYCAKESELDHQLPGRRWGHSANIPRTPLLTWYLSPQQAVIYRRIARRLMDRHHPRGAEAPRPTHRRRLARYAAFSQKIATFCDIATTARILRDCIGIPQSLLPGFEKYLPPERMTHTKTIFAPRELVSSAGSVFELPYGRPTSRRERDAYTPCPPTLRHWKPSPPTAPRPHLYNRGHGFGQRTAAREIPAPAIARPLFTGRRTQCTSSHQIGSPTISNPSSRATRSESPTQHAAKNPKTPTRFTGKCGQEAPATRWPSHAAKS
jgi:hypothetical protein